MATLVKPQTRLPLVVGCLGAAALLLAACGGGGRAAPALPAVTPTPLPAGQWMSAWEADALWQQIAGSATLVNPILRPNYLPPGLTEVRRLDSGERLSFALVYADARKEQWLTVVAGTVGNVPDPGPQGEQQQVVIRHTYATFQLYDKENPAGDAWMLWQEPGRWGAPDDPNLPNLDHVPYYISSRGLSRDELIKVADSLRPVEE